VNLVGFIIGIFMVVPDPDLCTPNRSLYKDSTTMFSECACYS